MFEQLASLKLAREWLSMVDGHIRDSEAFKADLAKIDAVLATPVSKAEMKAQAFDRIVAARKTWLEAAVIYNTRFELATAERLRGNWSIKLDEEYRAVSDAQSAFIRSARREADAALSATSEGDQP